MTNGEVSAGSCDNCLLREKVDTIVGQAGVDLLDESMGEIARGRIQRAGELVTAAEVFIAQAGKLDDELTGSCTEPNVDGQCTASDEAQIAALNMCNAVLAAQLGEV